MGTSIIPVCFVLIGIMSLVSAGVNDADLSMVAQCFPWFAIASLGLLCVFDLDRARMQKGICVLGIVASAASILMLSNLIDFAGAINAGRLQFTFQYANAAGIFFAVCSVLCICSKDRIVIMIPGRLLQASSTLLERIDQIRDACLLVSQSPLFGLGPDGWESAYAFVQSADYIASSVHCSYLQVWLDTGLLGFLVFVGMIVFGIWGAWRSGRYTIVVCIAMMALHFLIDFDIQFSSVGVLLGVLLYLGCAEALSVKARGLAAKFSALLLSVLVLGACLCGVFVNDRLDSITEQRIDLAS
ncbi:MAG: hypothetical protein HFJ64_01695 [Eggerthellaceae bacterium]|nr:hypothetical protein [Eggerthellaceae bacterium]